MLIRQRKAGLAATFAAFALGLAAPRAQAQDYFTPVMWDDRGVPHVVAGTDDQVFFGQGYAVAVDRIAELHRVREATYGRLAKLTGNPAVGAGEGKSALDQDKEVLTIDIRGVATQRLASMDGATRNALEAYAAGVNWYLQELHRLSSQGPIDDLLAEPLDDVQTQIEAGTYPEWTAEDSLAAWVWWIYMFEQGNGNYKGERTCSQPTAGFQPVLDDTFAVHVLENGDLDLTNGINDYWAKYHKAHKTDCYNPPAPLAPAQSQGGQGSGNTEQEEQRLAQESEGYHFSDTWVLSGAANTGGPAAAIQASPKTPMLSPTMFHEIHMKQSDPVAGFDARGVQIVGAPGLFLGFSDHVAWGGASLDADTDDLIKLITTSSDEFTLDGVTEDITTTPTPIDDGQGGTVTYDIKTTPIGPIVDDFIDADLKVNGETYVLRSADIWHEEERHTVQSAIRMLKARDVSSFRELSKYWVTPSLHSVVGDTNGDVGYQTLLSVPTRGDQTADAGLRVVCDGSQSSNDWVRILPFDYQPWTKQSTGYLAASNNRPAGCWYPIPMHYNVSKGPTTRTLRLFEILEGYDAAYPSVDEVEDLARMAYDGVMPHGRTVVEVALLFKNQPAGMVNCTSSAFDLSTTALNMLAPNKLEGWFLSGGESTLNPANPCGNGSVQLVKTSYRLSFDGSSAQSVATPMLAGDYGTGAGGFIGFMAELVDRDFGSDPLDCTDARDLEIFASWRSLRPRTARSASSTSTSSTSTSPTRSAA